jgi:hypothetical protein
MPQVGWCSSTVADTESAEGTQRDYQDAPYLFLLLCEIFVSHAPAVVGPYLRPSPRPRQRVPRACGGELGITFAHYYG